MKAQDFNHLLETLPELDSEQLEILSTRLKFLNGNKSGKEPDVDCMLQGIRMVLMERGIIGRTHKLTDGVLNYLVKDYKTRLETAQVFLMDQVAVKGVPQKVLVCYNAAVVLADYLTDRSIPVGLKTMITQAGNLPLILDRAFPGYARAGLLSVALGGKTNA